MSVFHLVLQVLVVLAVTSACGWMVRQVAQPGVVGEIAGGLLLGPLVLGRVAPMWSAILFPADSFNSLLTVSRIGLVLFLFSIGAELDLAAIRRNARTVAAITTGSLLLPFAIGAAIAPLLWRRFAGSSSSSFTGFVLFVGIAMSITALPVLASLLQDRKAIGRPVPAETAAMALLSAAASDAVGWCVLAVILVILGSSTGWGSVMLRAGLSLVFVAAMLLLVRPLLRVVLPRLPRSLAILLPLVLAFSSSSVTEWLGLHAFFGAFLAGLCLPRGEAVHSLLGWWRPVIRVTLPVFFALTGLRMQPDILNLHGQYWLLLIVVLAITGKIGGAASAARWSGMPWGQAGLIGVLLNTRGLVELIVLNVGYNAGVINASLFTLFVLMALITTAMTAPLLNLWPRPTLVDPAHSPLKHQP